LRRAGLRRGSGCINWWGFDNQPQSFVAFPVLHFLQRECFVDSILELFGELEVQQMLDQFFDRAVYYSILGYDETLYDQPRGAGSQKRSSLPPEHGCHESA
jgi:hypothetical protein